MYLLYIHIYMYISCLYPICISGSSTLCFQDKWISIHLFLFRMWILSKWNGGVKKFFFLGRCGDSMMPKNTFTRGGPKIYRKLYEMWTFDDVPGLMTRFPERKPFVLHRNDDSIKESHAFAGEGRSCTAWTSNSTSEGASRAWDSIERRPN